MYSLGTVIYAVFNKGKPVFEINKQDIYKSFSRQLDQVFIFKYLLALEKYLSAALVFFFPKMYLENSEMSVL